MRFLDRLIGIHRRHWHVCHTCMNESGHDAVKAIFYSEGPPVMLLGRPLMQCPRCAGTNTKSFQTLKEERAESQLWGLERVVRKHRRSTFIVNVNPDAHAADVKPKVNELTTRQ